jgi:formate-dependent phosphoribosylglycinamide formyltransferase (GAR transformylase)
MSDLVIFVAPFYKPSVTEFVDSLGRVPGVRLALISQDPWERFPEQVRNSVAFWQVQDGTSADHIAHAAHQLGHRHGKKAHRILSITEQIQLQVAEVRERLGIDGMSAATIRKFRDKGIMKEAFRAAGVPCARHCAAHNVEAAHRFLQQVGFPVCVKPVDGAAAQATFKVDTMEVLDQILHASAPSQERPLQIEEFVVGDEFSLETFSVDGQHLWHSLTQYEPTPLNVVNNPWIQWKVICPREVDDPEYDDIKAAGRQALDALGMQSGLTHLEWFRRPDGSIAISEVAARPPGAEIVTMINRCHDVDAADIWSQVMVRGELPSIPPRKYASGAAFLRGMGGGRVRAVHGLEVLDGLGDMVTDKKIPQPGDPAANTYEGEGFVLVRHAETQTVRQALACIIDKVRVELI